GQSVDLVVRGHDGGGPGADSGAGGGEVDVVEFAEAEVGLGGVTAADRGTLSGEVLEDDGGLVGREPGGPGGGVALHPPDECLGETGGEVGVLAEALLRAAPARVAGDVQGGDEGHVAAAGAEFGGGVGGGLLVQAGVPGGADGQVDREDRAVQGHVAVRHL